MNLFQYMLLPFGMTQRHRIMDQIFNGIAVSFFGLMFMTCLLSLPVDISLMPVLMKITSLGTQLMWIRAFIFLKRNSENIYGMFDAILDFEGKQCPKQRLNFGFSLILFIICFMSSYIIAIYFTLSNVEFNKLFTLITFKLYLYHHASVTFLYFIYWMFLFQFIYIEFCDKYYNVLKFSINYIKKYFEFRPDFLLRHQIEEVIENFEENDKQFKQNVRPLRKIIIIMVIFVNLQVLVTFSVLPDSSNCYHLYILLFFVNFYPIFTQIIIYEKSKIQNILITNIKDWKKSENTNKPLLVVIV